MHLGNVLAGCLKQHQWKVTCNCFVDRNGTPFDRQKLKVQKKPKKNASLIETAVAQLA
jgi:hypothetical protein